LTPFGLRFGRKPSVSHLWPFGFKCFVLKCDNLDKFESRSSDGILLGYTPYGRSYRVFNLKTNTIIESCDVTFDETAPCPHDVFECCRGWWHAPTGGVDSRSLRTASCLRSMMAASFGGRVEDGGVLQGCGRGGGRPRTRVKDGGKLWG
jgi:hypothetical protein